LKDLQRDRQKALNVRVQQTALSCGIPRLKPRETTWEDMVSLVPRRSGRPETIPETMRSIQLLQFEVTNERRDDHWVSQADRRLDLDLFEKASVVDGVRDTVDVLAAFAEQCRFVVKVEPTPYRDPKLVREAAYAGPSIPSRIRYKIHQISLYQLRLLYEERSVTVRSPPVYATS